jgi:hypothetical protein
MSKADYEYKFEVVFDKEKETTLQKIKRWINKQKPPLNTVYLYLFSFVEKWYWEGKELQTKHRIDQEVKAIGKLWDEEDERNRPKPEVVETGVFGEEGWSISMSNPSVDRGPKEFESSMGIASNEVRLSEKIPDPWDSTGDWNDWAIGFTLETSKDELRKGKTDRS